MSNPYTLTGTKITEVDSSLANLLSARVHRQAAEQENHFELWYYRDSTWSLFPSQPIVTFNEHPVLTQEYRQPATLEFKVHDHLGLHIVTGKPLS